MNPQLEPVLKDIKKKFESAASKKSDTVPETVRPKRIKVGNPEWLKAASRAESSNNKIDDYQSIRRSGSVSASKKSFETATTKNSETSDVVREKHKLTTRGNPEWLKASINLSSQGNQVEELQSIQRSSSVSVQSSKKSFEAAKLVSKDRSDNAVSQKPKKTVRDNPEWLKASQPDSTSVSDDRERTSSVSVQTSKTSFEGKDNRSDSFKTWKQKKDSDKKEEDEKLSSLFNHLSPDEKKAEIELLKMKKNVDAQLKVEKKYENQVVAVLELKKPGAETHTIKFTNVGSGIAEKFTSLSCTISQFKTPEQMKAEQGQESICWEEPESADDPLESSEDKDSIVKVNGEVDSGSINFTNVKAGMAERFTSNIMLKTPEQVKAERSEQERAKKVQVENIEDVPQAVVDPT